MWQRPKKGWKNQNYYSQQRQKNDSWQGQKKLHLEKVPNNKDRNMIQSKSRNLIHSQDRFFAASLGTAVSAGLGRIAKYM